MRFGRNARRDKGTLITDAQPSPEDQFAYRRRRYAITMGTRILCLILAAAFYHILWLALLFAAGAVILPWVAVVMANDRLPTQPTGFQKYDGRTDGALPSGPDDSRVIENPRIIDQ